MVKTFQLKNNIDVVLEDNPHVRTISLGIWIKNGSVDEDESNNGISHFVEHMLFKGTLKRTTKDIAEEMSEVGGRINAFTGKEYMCYYAHVLNDHFDVALDVLSDMICNPKIDAEDIEKEKKVIMEELSMYEDSPEDVVNDGLKNAIWPDHPIGYNIIGTADNIKSFSADTIREYLAEHYIGQQIVISVVGHLEKTEVILAKLEESFKSIQKGELKRRTRKVTYNRVFENYDKDIEQAHLCMAFPTIPYDSEDIYKLAIINTLIGGGLNSRLFQRIREDRGMAYSIYSFTENYQHGGLFVIYAATTPAQLNEVVGYILEELDKIIETGFNSKELASTKEQIKSNLIIGLESMNARMSSYGKSKLILNRIKSQDLIIKKINAVTMKGLTEFLIKMLKYSEMSIAITGPKADIDIEGIKKRWKDLE
ncbi:MAG: pitrilysin family protein [Vallitaleaceae bacterium]|jgi:predicted Zn-dependent peptidase|nr:pitrilysin family protein [Vallitaleaceae bacterium]